MWSLGTCFFSLSIMFLRFVQIVACTNTLFSKLPANILLCSYTTIYVSIPPPLGYLYDWATMTHATVNICGHISV